jgi:hypothetical protein
MIREYITAMFDGFANCPRGSVNVTVFIGIIKLFGLRNFEEIIFHRQKILHKYRR